MSESPERKVFAKFDKYGNPIGFYPSDVWTTPPAGAVEITLEQYNTFFSDTGVKAFRFIDGKVVQCNLLEQQAQYNADKPTVVPPPMTIPMSYTAAITAGIRITSADDVIEPCSIAVTAQQLANLANVSIYTHINKRFPGGQETYPLIKTDGTSIEIPTLDAWQEISTAAADYVALCDVALRAALAVPNGRGEWVSPNNEALIS